MYFVLDCLMGICLERADRLAFRACFILYAVSTVCVLFPHGVWGRMWNLIVSDPDHCLFIFCLEKSCPFGLPHVPFVNCCQFMYLVISLLFFEGRIWDLIISVPDHCLSFYFSHFLQYISSGFRCRVITGSLMRLY